MSLVDEVRLLMAGLGGVLTPMGIWLTIEHWMRLSGMLLGIVVSAFGLLFLGASLIQDISPRPSVTDDWEEENL